MLKNNPHGELPALPLSLRNPEPPFSIRHFLDLQSYLHGLLMELRAREERELGPPEAERAWAEILERCDEQLIVAARMLIDEPECSPQSVAAKALVVLELCDGGRGELGTVAARALAQAILQYFGSLNVSDLRKVAASD